jgi:hypothetical protein
MFPVVVRATMNMLAEFLNDRLGSARGFEGGLPSSRQQNCKFAQTESFLRPLKSVELFNRSAMCPARMDNESCHALHMRLKLLGVNVSRAG